MGSSRKQHPQPGAGDCDGCADLPLKALPFRLFGFQGSRWMYQPPALLYNILEENTRATADRFFHLPVHCGPILGNADSSTSTGGNCINQTAAVGEIGKQLEILQ